MVFAIIFFETFSTFSLHMVFFRNIIPQRHNIQKTFFLQAKAIFFAKTPCRVFLYRKGGKINRCHNTLCRAFHRNNRKILLHNLPCVSQNPPTELTAQFSVCFLIADAKHAPRITYTIPCVSH